MSTANERHDNPAETTNGEIFPTRKALTHYQPRHGSTFSCSFGDVRVRQKSLGEHGTYDCRAGEEGEEEEGVFFYLGTLYFCPML